MDVEITVKVGGQFVKRHVQAVDGTLEQMEEAIQALAHRVAADACRRRVDQLATAHPFRPPAGNGGTAATGRGRSSDSPGR